MSSPVSKRHQLPDTIQGFGGLGFRPSGEYISAPMSIFAAGPLSPYEDFVKATISSKLTKADNDAQVGGWRANGVRARLDKFLSDGFHTVMRRMGNHPKALVHADFST